MTDRMKPILGVIGVNLFIWYVLMFLASDWLMQLGFAGDGSLDVLGPITIPVYVILLTLFYDTVIQITGASAMTVAMVLGVSEIMATEVLFVMVAGTVFTTALITAGLNLLFWWASGTVYGKLSE